MPGLYTHTTRATGLILTALIYNQDHQNHIDNQTPQMTDDYSASVAEMRATTNPGAVGSESLATSLSGELERIRYSIQQLHGGAQWYPAKPTLLLLDTATVTTSATKDFETAAWFDGTYEELEFVLTDIRVQTDNDNMWFRVKAGGSYQADVGDYLKILDQQSASSSLVDGISGTNTRGLFMDNIDSATTQVNCSIIRLITKPDIANLKVFHFDSYWLNNSGNIHRYNGFIRTQVAEAITGMRFGCDTTTFSARIRVYGRPA